MYIMPQYGIYDPENTENSSDLFSFQEVPVTSTKVNCWNGNINAGFQLIQQILSTITSQSQNAVLTSHDNTPLKVRASSPEDMNVSVEAGWAVIQNALAGLGSQTTLPIGGVFNAPSSNPRIDLVVLKNSGAMDVITGVESASPIAPAAPSNSIAIARVYLRPGSDAIYNEDQGSGGYITDARELFSYGEVHKHADDLSPSENPDGIRTQFSTQHMFRSNTLDVYLNGVLQSAGTDYSEDVDRLGYTFVSPPLSTYQIQHRYIIDREV
jgi:hypothetical protein